MIHQETVNGQLQSAYLNYLSGLCENKPELRDSRFSSLYCTCVSDTWLNSESKMLIVGKEGYGVKPRSFSSLTEEILWAQNFNYRYLYDQLFENKYGYERNYRSRFWRTVGQISAHIPCCWTNIDKIHYQKDNSSRNNCPLSGRDRALLHSGSPILKKETELLHPTHVAFLGWYWCSLKHELPELYELIYKADTDVNRNPYAVFHNGIRYIFCCHPAYRKIPKDYADKVTALL